MVFFIGALSFSRSPTPVRIFSYIPFVTLNFVGPCAICFGAIQKQKLHSSEKSMRKVKGGLQGLHQMFKVPMLVIINMYLFAPI